MLLTEYVKPRDTLKGYVELDMRVVPNTVLGKPLEDLIHKSVQWHQKFIISELPSKLIVTQLQFASLNYYTEEMQHTTDRIFVVQDADGKVMGIMEVVIDDAIDQVEEIDDIIKEAEALLAEEKTYTADELIAMGIDPTDRSLATPLPMEPPINVRREV